VTGYEEILSVYSRMETWLNAKFFSRGSCVLEAAGGSDAAGTGYQQRLTDIVTYIDRGEKMRALAETDLLFADLEMAGSLSPMYVKYLCSNLVHHCTEVNRQLSAEEVSEYVNRLFQCANIYILRDVMLGLMDEMLPDAEGGQSTIRRVLEIVEQEYMKDISLEQIADRVQLSPSYLSFYFKKETGRNFIKYLTMYRLEKAKELLRTTDIKVITISEMVGYLNSSYFCLLFKNYTGQTPARFREEGSC
jgi:two-component system response regulator YesN